MNPKLSSTTFIVLQIVIRCICYRSGKKKQGGRFKFEKQNIAFWCIFVLEPHGFTTFRSSLKIWILTPLGNFLRVDEIDNDQYLCYFIFLYQSWFILKKLDSVEAIKMKPEWLLSAGILTHTNGLLVINIFHLKWLWERETA